MALKDLFKEAKTQYLAATSLDQLTGNLESADYIKFYLRNKDRFVPLVDYSKPENFARFGSAEKYYYDSINWIADNYPYDGSKKEQILWELSSSYLDLYIFENDYPRTTGYAVFTTASLTATDVSTGNWGSYGAAGTASYEYVFVNGGPNEGIGNAIYLDPDSGEAKYRKNANIWDTSKNRECNLKIGGTDGNTVEFWLKKAAFNPAATRKEVIFDIHTTSSISSSADYGRLRIEMSGHGVATNTQSPFYITYVSGTSGVANYSIGSSITTASVADNEWHHYAFRMKNSGTDLIADLFIDGEHNHRITRSGAAINYVSGTIVGNIAALATHPSGTHAGAPAATKGWGKLSGSIDEFRYWKIWRNSEQIQTRWFDQYGGGTNTDDANTDLGVYYKFNEGITLTSSIDSRVLDFSGRVSNGTWTGYSSEYSRNTGSAINSANITLTNFTGSEFRDPIVYKQHPAFRNLVSSKRRVGKEYDFTNSSNIYYSLPAWIIEDHDANNPDNDGIIDNSLWNLTQIISSYFDVAASQIQSLPSLAQPNYPSASMKPVPFIDRILESKGFISPEIFSAIDALESFENRDNNSLYSQKIYDIKNTIYRNIYNNLTYINKSKGTEKSFRNLVRCFGIDDEIYKFNMYGNNVEYILRDNFRTISERYRLINFNDTFNSDAVVYQYSSSANPNSTTFISASNVYDSTQEGAGLPFTVEANIIFPNRVDQGDYHSLRKDDTAVRNQYPLLLTSSLFGMHTAIDTDPAETTWNPNDYANFIVRAVKTETFTNKAYFVLTGSAGGFMPELSSSVFDEVYSDKNWQFMVSLYPSAYPNANEVSGTADKDYTVQFSGIHSITDTTINEFTVTGTMTSTQAAQFLASPKRLFVGAHRTNFTGSLITRSDVKFNTLRVWQNKLSIDDLRMHSRNPKNYGFSDPEQNAYLFNTSINKVYVPNKETLLLHWNFDNVTGSDASGEFIVEDLTSGSVSQINRYGWLGNLAKQQYIGKAFEFSTSSADVVVIDEIVTARPNLPEVMSSDDTITVMQNDDVYFTREKRPIFFDLYVEKSAYQNISEEMMKFIATIVDFNQLIGQPVDRYRDEYKALAQLRQLFFQRVTNPPDIDKYIEYFKWFDVAISAMIQQIAPMSSGLSERPLRNIIESHILERNKYRSKFPSYEFKQSDPEGSLLGVNEMLYEWDSGHAPLNESQNTNCNWWKDRADRSGVGITSGDTGVDSDRNTILTVLNNQNNASAPNLSGSTGTYSGSVFAIRRFARPYKIRAAEARGYGGGVNFSKNKNLDYIDPIVKIFDTNTAVTRTNELRFNKSDFFSSSCEDDSALNDKPPVDFWVRDSGPDANPIGTGEQYAPFNIVSSSAQDTLFTNVNVVNLHNDTYGPNKEVPMQGPFTEKFVGGKQYRHIWTNFDASDTKQNRPEGWRYEDGAATAYIIPAAQTAPQVFDADLPRAVYYRDEVAKRPVNIKNLLQGTGSTEEGLYTVLGNYSKGYEIVMTNGRSINNRYLAESDGELPTTSTDNFYISGAVDYTLPRRDLTGSNSFIIVNRFAAPGGPATMGEGMLDVEAAEYSVYNALPFRNLEVIQPLNELYSDHSKQFGYFSDAFNSASYVRAGLAYPGTSGSVTEDNYDGNPPSASFHKVNRNTRKQIKYGNEYAGDLATIITASVYDNWFVQHQIPQTDVRYAWITSSLIDNYSGPGLYWFEQPDFSNASLASTDLTFLSASDSGSGDFKVDFAGLNTLVVDNVLSASNLLSSSNYFNNSFSTLNSLMETNALVLHRNGPYGSANWKLYKKDNHPIVRAHRSENRLSYIKPLTVKNTVNNFTLQTREIASVFEPPITSKYKPLVHDLLAKQSQIMPLPNADGTFPKTKTQKTVINHSYGNNVNFFTDHSEDEIDLDSLLLGKENKDIPQQTVDIINYYINSPQIPEFQNPIAQFNSLMISETIFPKGQYTYLSKIRQRENYVNGFWRDSRTIRASRGEENLVPFLDLTVVENPAELSDYGLNITASIWDLDARLNYATASPGRIKSGTLEGSISSGELMPIISGTSDQAGLLQNSLYPYSPYLYITGASAPVNTGEKFAFYSILVPQYNRRVASVIPSDTTHEYKSGDTKWEAGEQASLSPFYDTYSDYVDDIKRTGKGHGLMPEFRMSEHMDFYLNQASGDFLVDNTASFSITGSIVSSSANNDFYKTYSNTDFLETFSVINDDYNETADATKITLSVDALIKFLPYDGFYPSERTTQLSKMFFESYQNNFAITGNIFNRSGEGLEIGADLNNAQAGFIGPIWKSLFAPGILYNSVKSGMAVDYPVHTTNNPTLPLRISGSPNQRNSLGYLEDIPRIATDFDYRIPFEALLDPEGEIGPAGQIIDNEPHPSSSLNLTASLAGTGKNNYKLAMNNFLASTIDFFKADGKLTTLSSLPDNDPNFGNFDLNKEYRMRIVCSHAKFKRQSDITKYFSTLNSKTTASFIWNPQSLVMYARTGSDPTARADYYGSSFGPPIWNGTLLQNSDYGLNNGLLYGSASYEPYTPSYYDGYSHIELIYRPEVEGESLPSIVSQLSQSFVRYKTGFHQGTISGSAEKSAMNLSASLNYLQLATEPNVIFDQLGNPIQIGGDSVGAGTKLVIQPKWESPVLNFKDVTVTLPSIGSGSVARGMWHQYGSIPVGQEGLVLQIQDLDSSELSNPKLTGSLADVMGFKKTPVKIGTIAESKTISEAVVAIPYYFSPTGIQSKFLIERDTVDMAIEIVDSGGISPAFKEIITAFPERKPTEEVIDMVRKMKKFVIPPKFDFVTNKNIKPFAMFIFDFEVTLSQQDLANIWQNLTPKVGTSFQKTSVSLPVDIFMPNEQKGTGLMGDRVNPLFPNDVRNLPDTTRWMVFKAKQRAAYNYFAKTAQSTDDDRYKFKFNIGAAGAEKESVPNYSYNWPFDFFSLVELAKIDTTVEITPQNTTVNSPPDKAIKNDYFATEVFEEASGQPSAVAAFESGPSDTVSKVEKSLGSAASPFQQTASKSQFDSSDAAFTDQVNQELKKSAQEAAQFEKEQQQKQPVTKEEELGLGTSFAAAGQQKKKRPGAGKGVKKYHSTPKKKGR